MNKNLLFISFVIVMSTSYQFGYNIGVLNQPVAVKFYYLNCSIVNSKC